MVLLAGSWLGWIGVAGTLYANVMSGLPRGPLAATVAAWPAVAFTVASFMLERLEMPALLRRPVRPDARTCPGCSLSGQALRSGGYMAAIE